MSDTNIKRLYELIEGNEEAIILLNQLVEERNTFLNASTYDELTKVYNRRVLRNNIDLFVFHLKNNVFSLLKSSDGLEEFSIISKNHII